MTSVDIFGGLRTFTSRSGCPLCLQTQRPSTLAASTIALLATMAMHCGTAARMPRLASSSSALARAPTARARSTLAAAPTAASKRQHVREPPLRHVAVHSGKAGKSGGNEQEGIDTAAVDAVADVARIAEEGVSAAEDIALAEKAEVVKAAEQARGTYAPVSAPVPEAQAQTPCSHALSRCMPHWRLGRGASHAGWTGSAAAPRCAR